MDYTSFLVGQQNAYNQQIFAREDTAVQRRVADLKAAGLSPILAANGQGASAGGQTQSPANAINVAMDYMVGMAQANAAAMNAQANMINGMQNAQANMIQAQANRLNAQTNASYYAALGDYYKALTGKVPYDIENVRGSTGKVTEETKGLKMNNEFAEKLGISPIGISAALNNSWLAPEAAAIIGAHWLNNEISEVIADDPKAIDVYKEVSDKMSGKKAQGRKPFDWLKKDRLKY